MVLAGIAPELVELQTCSSRPVACQLDLVEDSVLLAELAELFRLLPAEAIAETAEVLFEIELFDHQEGIIVEVAFFCVFRVLPVLQVLLRQVDSLHPETPASEVVLAEVLLDSRGDELDVFEDLTGLPFKYAMGTSQDDVGTDNAPCARNGQVIRVVSQAVDYSDGAVGITILLLY
jgi:hypothetical protein